eukprot:5195071-Amphidinium_carterae.1
MVPSPNITNCQLNLITVALRVSNINIVFAVHILFEQCILVRDGGSNDCWKRKTLLDPSVLDVILPWQQEHYAYQTYTRILFQSSTWHHSWGNTTSKQNIMVT